MSTRAIFRRNFHIIVENVGVEALLPTCHDEPPEVIRETKQPIQPTIGGMMRPTMISGILAGVLSALVATDSLAEQDHKAEAMKHAAAALESAKTGDATAVGEHAKVAKEHAEAAEKEKANPHLEAAIKNLNEAIEQSKLGQAESAGDAAHGAMTHLKAAEKSF